MEPKQLHKLIPDIAEGELSSALKHNTVRLAANDLKEALSQLSKCATGSQTRTDWETTRDELLAEIRRLTKRLNGES